MVAMPRALVEPFTVHGGRLDQARAAFPGVGVWTDLSTGIAPWAYPAGSDAEVRERLPDPQSLAGLEAVAAAAFGVSADRVLAVPGSDLALRLIGAILPGSAGWIAPGYSGHRDMWQGRAERIGRAALPTAADHHRHLVLARPNNPDAWIADRAMIEDVARVLAARGGHLIVDEAFADATPDDSLASCDWPGLIVLRSFGKFFGLAGLRLGFVIAAPKTLGPLRALLGDWPISGPAIAAGCAAYADRDWQHAQRTRLLGGSHRLADTMCSAGLRVIGQTGYFVLVDTAERDALFCHLARSGVLTRPFASESRWLRLGLPNDEAGWTRLTAGLDTWSAR
jgi:cobalamin biosynthetic protein CobC